MTIPSKIAGGLSLVSCITDIHKTAVIYANKGYAQAGSDSFISNSVGSQKSDNVSYKDTNRKNWLYQHDFGCGFFEVTGRIGGYLKGVAQGVLRYLPNFALSGLALFTNNTKGGKTVGNLSAIGLAGLEIYDFIKNSTNIFQRKDYLNSK